jgi:ABC-2 type transport system permease protein
MKKAIVENFRDWKILIMGISFAPFFVVLMYFYFGEATQTYSVAFINRDRGAVTEDGNEINLGQALVSEIQKYTDPEGASQLEVSLEIDLEEAQKKLKNNNVDLVVEIAPDFTEILLEYQSGRKPDPTILRTFGNPANPKSIMAAAWSDSLAYQYAMEWSGSQGPLTFEAESLPLTTSLTDFDLYVPGLLGLALMMLMFTAAATLIKEKDKGTLLRLRLSEMTTTEWMIAMGLSQVIIGLMALALTYLSALIFGYHSTGSLLAVTIVGILSCLAIIAISVLVAALLRTVFDLMTIGCFPFFILMFFSGGMFPIPTITLFSLGERSINVNDILPTTHSITAFGKILNQGAGLGDVSFEMGAIALLTILYFACGVWLFTRRHMRSQ